MTKRKRHLTGWILFGLSILLSRMYVRETLTYYVLPWFTHIVLVTSIILGLISIYVITSKAHFHAISHHTRGFQMGALALVILLGLFLPPKPLSHLSATNRGIQSNLQEVRVNEKQGDNNISDQGLTFPEVILLIQSEGFASIDTKGKRIHAKGFVHTATSGLENEFDIVQYQMACCIADARPVGIRVRSEDGNPFETGEWVEVFGELVHDPIESGTGNSYIIIPEKVQKTQMFGPPFFY